MLDFTTLPVEVGAAYVEHPADHGWPSVRRARFAKILEFPFQPNHAPYAPLTLSPGLQGFLELLSSLLLTLGLFTRPVAFILAGDMAVAYFMVYAPRSSFPLLNGGELAIVYCFVFLYFGITGAANGASIDQTRPRLHRSCQPHRT